jgi:hypothetical protein
VPDEVPTRRRPASSMPTALPLPSLHATGWPSSASRSRQAAMTASWSVLGRAVERSGGLAQRGREVLGTDSDIQPDAEHRPALSRSALDQDAGDFAALDEHVIGPLDAGGVAHGLGRGDPGLERDESGVVHAQDEREQQRSPGGRGPGPSLSTAPGGLLAGGHQGAVRRPGLGEVAGALVGRVGAAQVQARMAEARGHAVMAPRAGGARSRGAARVRGWRCPG